MDLIQKFLKRLDAKRQRVAEDLLKRLYARDFDSLDLKKLQGYQNRYRVRKGQMRIIFEMIDVTIKIIDIDNRNDNTY